MGATESAAAAVGQAFAPDEAFMREVFATLFDRKDIEGAKRFWGPHSVDHFLALGRSVSGPEDLAAFFQGVHDALPDLVMEVEHVTISGAEAIVRWRMRGTFDGAPFEGIRATGRRIDLRGCDCFVWGPDGKLDSNTVYYDGAAFARQIGLLPAQHSTADRAMLASFNGLTRVRRALLR